MKAAIELADIDDTAHTKKPSSRYLSPRSGMSSHRHIRKLRPKTRFPACHRYLGKCSYRAKPAAECLTKQERNGCKRQQQKHCCGMHAGNLAAQQPVLEIHHAGDR